MAEFVQLFEVGPRDGLQNEARLIPTAEKIAFIDQLSRCGFEKIEVASFVSPKWVPQMADGAEVLAGITRAPDVTYAALTPNLKGYEGARAAGADEVAIFASASEGFSQKNINCSIDESLERFLPVMDAAKRDGRPVRGYVSCVIACPYDGATAPGNVAEVAEKLFEMGCYAISLGDTIGAGEAYKIRALLRAVVQGVPASRLAGHFHDTGGRAIANIGASLEMDIRVFDAAIGGLGGCPYAPGAKGNVDTLEVARFIEAEGLRTRLDFAALEEAARLAHQVRKAAP